MNLICENRALTVVGSSSQPCGLDELKFFVAKEYQGYQLILVLNSGDQYDAVKMRQVNSDKQNYYSYECDGGYVVKIKTGACALSVIGINMEDTADMFSTNAVTVVLKNDSYNFKATINMIESFSVSAANTYSNMYALYQKMNNLAELNIKMLKDMEGGDKS